MDMTISEIIAILIALSMSRIVDVFLLVVGFFTGRFTTFSIINLRGSARNESDDIHSNNKTLNFGGFRFSLLSFHRHESTSEQDKESPKNKDDTK